MFGYLLRALKRFLVLIPGVAMTYLAARDIYPVFNRHVPELVAIFATYVVTAYILIPAAMRLLRIVIKQQHIPLYCTTPDGFACDPVNIGIIGTQAELIEAMTAAGWDQADSRTIPNLFREALALALKRPYPNAPFSSLYLLGRSQDIGFQKAVGDNPRHRHHVRFWAASFTSAPQYMEHVDFWQRQHAKRSRKRILWVGAASQDTGIRPIRHNAQLTHMIDPDTDAERELIVRDLKAAKVIQHRRRVTIGSPYQLRNRVLGGYMHADGKMVIIEL